MNYTLFKVYKLTSVGTCAYPSLNHLQKQTFPSSPNVPSGSLVMQPTHPSPFPSNHSSALDTIDQSALSEFFISGIIHNTLFAYFFHFQYFQVHSCCMYQYAYCIISYSLVDGHWGCFQVFMITNKATVNIHVKIFKWRCIFLPFE